MSPIRNFFHLSPLLLALPLLLPSLFSLLICSAEEEDMASAASAPGGQPLPVIICRQFPGLEACQQRQPMGAAMEKRKSAYMRFGKRKSAYMRFGKRAMDEEEVGANGMEMEQQPMEKRKSAYMRFGKRKSAYMRFGRK